jgi:hypothetical protein
MIVALPRRIQQLAQRQLVRISFNNAMGFGFLTGQTIYLIALLYGANDTQMGFLYAAPFVTALAAVFVPLLLNGNETTTMWSRSWWLRTLFCFGYFSIPLVGATHTRVWLLVLIYYMFMTTRAFGLAGYYTVIRGLSTPKDSASLMAKTLLFGQFGVLLTQIIGFGSLTLNLTGTEANNLYLLLIIGIVFNAATAWQIGQLPRTGYLRNGSMRNLGRIAGQMLHNREYIEVALVTAFQAAMSVFAGYLISYLRKVANFSSGTIFLFTVAGVAGAIFISNLQRLIGHRIRERIVLLACHSTLTLLSLLWALIHLLPKALSASVLFICFLYALTVVVLTASTTIALRLRTERLPSKDSVQHSIVYDLTQAAGALLAISLTQATAKFFFRDQTAIHPYSMTFLLWTLTSVAVCVLAVRMGTDSNRGLKQEFSALLPSSIFTIIRARRLDQNDNIIRRHLALEGLLQNPNTVSRELILEHLQSPDIGTRSSCIRVLMGYPMDEANPFLIKEATSPFSPLRDQAITALGFTEQPALIPTLRDIRKDAPPEIQAIVIKSLLRLGDHLSDEDIVNAWNSCPRRPRIDILIGLAVTRHTHLLLQFLGMELEDRPDSFWTQTLFGVAAAAYDLREIMFDIFTEEHEHAGKGFDHLIANLELPWPTCLTPDACRSAITQNDFASLNRMLRQVCNLPWVITYDRTTALGVIFLLLNQPNRT